MKRPTPLAIASLVLAAILLGALAPAQCTTQWTAPFGTGFPVTHAPLALLPLPSGGFIAGGQSGSVGTVCHRPPYESHSSSVKRSHRGFGQVEPGQFGQVEPPWFGEAEPRARSSRKSMI